MIKKFVDFINESNSKAIKLSKEEVNLFSQEPLLQKLISDKKVRLFDDKVEYDESDTQTKEVLDQYLELPGKVEERLKNYKLFLEGFKDDDEFKQGIQELKKSLFIMFTPIFAMEKIIRMVGDTKKLEEGADSLIELMISMWSHSLEGRDDLDEQFKDMIMIDFTEALKKSRPTFIEKSFQLGIEQSLDFLINKLEEFKKRKESEGEEWREEKEVSYDDMSKKEINDLIDKALDERDFERVKFLSQFLKESITATDEVTEAIGQFCETLLNFIVDNYYIS